MVLVDKVEMVVLVDKQVEKVVVGMD